MTKELEPAQRLFLWLLATNPQGGMYLKDVKLSFKSAAKRKELASLGYTEETSRKPAEAGRAATYVELTEGGWAWCQDHLETPINTRSPLVQVVLQNLLGILARFFRAQEGTVSLGQLIQQASQVAEANDDSVLANQRGETTNGNESANGSAGIVVKQAILDACLELGGGRHNTRIRLADLRPKLGRFARHEVDRALLAMEQAGQLTAQRLDNPDEITGRDRDAVLLSPAGTDQHIVYFGGNSR